MSPSARLISYYMDNNERVVADSILLEVEDSLPTKVTKTIIDDPANLSLLFMHNSSEFTILAHEKKQTIISFSFQVF